jgi:hypothetical protein
MQFGVLAPTNASTWKIRVEIIRPANQFERFNAMRGLWSFLRKRGDSFSTAMRETWTTPILSGHQVIESDLITNSVAQP